MTDGKMWLLAALCWLGAYLALPIPWAVGSVIGVAGWFLDRWFVAVVGCVLLVTSLAAYAWSSLVPISPGPWEGTATLASDPVARPGGVSVDLLVDGHRVRAQAWSSAAGGLRNRLLGERVEVEGSVRPPTNITPWLASRGITGSMTVTHVGRWRTGRVHHRIANSLRRTIESGATSLSRTERSLLTGFVYGDDRSQSALTADAFRAAGLTHLLAVSGQNVAFVLVICGPMLRRFDYRGRFGLVLLILLLFATVTRFEASVLRASVMAAVAALATVIGRDTESRRVLAIAIVVLLLVAPLIVHALAFQLSVAASVGILFLSPHLVGLVPGPRFWKEAVSVTAGAQLAVAPLIVATFGGLPVASLPANLLAGPAAGPIMMWGLTAGTLAGGVARPFAGVIHMPTRLLLGWVAGVAEMATRVGLGELRRSHLVAIAVSLVAARLAGRGRVRQAAALAVAIALAAPAAAIALRPPTSFVVDDHSHVWRDRSRTVLVLDSSTDSEDLLEVLRTSAIRRIDLIVAVDGDRRAFSLVNELSERYPVGGIWAPSGHRLPGADAITKPITLTIGQAEVTVSPAGDELAVAAIRPRSPP